MDFRFGAQSNHLLPPFYKYYNKRLVKSPKLYFLDTGLVCSLLGINDKNQLNDHFMKRPLFETFIISEIIKERTNKFLPLNIFYWRDNVGNELDSIQEEGSYLNVIKIKSGGIINHSFF